MRVAVVYEDAWSLSELEVSANGRTTRVTAAHEVLVWVNDSWAEQSITIEVAGVRDGERYAFGRTDMTPLLGVEVRATISLSRLPCGDWCTAGSIACDGDGVTVCEEVDGCMRWHTPLACPSAAPFCSLGVCDTSCVDECAAGERRCAGPGGTEECGQADSDTCLEWLSVVACAEGESCSFGSCTSVCRNECEADEIRCQNGGTARCADRDFDGCTEWGPSEACASGESCQSGACRPIGECTDECTANECSGTTLTQCGNYDLDPCLEASPGSSCMPADPCMEGRCTIDGCETIARVCDAPPASHCVDSSTLRVYDAIGSCSAGACNYGSRDQSCPSCPACDSCAGVSCNSPPGQCYAASGTCANGICSYAPTDGASCDDGNPCTEADRCNGTVCAGTPKRCDSPPAPICLGTTTLRTYFGPGTCESGGTCSYTYDDVACPDCSSSPASCGGCTTCAASTPMALPGGRFVRSVSATSSHNGSCGGAGGETFFTFTIAQRSDAFIAAWGGAVDAVLYVRQCGCESGPEMGCGTDTSGEGLSTLSLTGLEPGTYNVFVDTEAPMSTELTIDIYVTPEGIAGDRCGRPQRIARGATRLSGETCIASSEYEPSQTTGCPNADTGNAKELVYYVFLPTDGEIVVNGCSGTATFDTVLYLRDRCASSPSMGVELCNDDGCGGSTSVCAATPRRSAFRASGLGPGLYYLFVDGYQYATEGCSCGSFEIVLSGV